VRLQEMHHAGVAGAAGAEKGDKGGQASSDGVAEKGAAIARKERVAAQNDDVVEEVEVAEEAEVELLKRLSLMWRHRLVSTIKVMM